MEPCDLQIAAFTDGITSVRVLAQNVMDALQNKEELLRLATLSYVCMWVYVYILSWFLHLSPKIKWFKYHWGLKFTKVVIKSAQLSPQRAFDTAAFVLPRSAAELRCSPPAELSQSELCPILQKVWHKAASAPAAASVVSAFASSPCSSAGRDSPWHRQQRKLKVQDITTWSSKMCLLNSSQFNSPVEHVIHPQEI